MYNLVKIAKYGAAGLLTIGCVLCIPAIQELSPQNVIVVAGYVTVSNTADKPYFRVTVRRTLRGEFRGKEVDVQASEYAVSCCKGYAKSVFNPIKVGTPVTVYIDRSGTAPRELWSKSEETTDLIRELDRRSVNQKKQ